MSTVINVKGTLTNCMRGTSKFDKDEKLHISIKFAEGERDKLIAACDAEGVFNKVSDGFKPKWYKDEKAEYLNFKSQFDVPTIYVGDTGKVETSIEAMLADFGILTGSDVIVAVTLKDGAIYPRAVAFRTLKVTSVSDLFGDEI